MPDLDAAERFLIAAQDDDGCLRDYALEPGASDAWTTAVAALALGARPGSDGARRAAAAAARAVAARRRPDGWGYNAHTAADADSTAWATLLLAPLGAAGPDPVGPLAGFLDAAGDAHTFRGPRFGAWAQAHADVTPVVGRALAAAGAPAALLARVRAAVVRGWRSGRPAAYWWESDVYAVAQSLAFLRETGGIAQPIAALARQLVGRQPAAASTFEAAHFALARAHLGLPARPRLPAQLADGGFPASRGLRVPAQTPAGVTTVHADERRVLSTAVALLALKLARVQGAGGYRYVTASRPPDSAERSIASHTSAAR